MGFESQFWVYLIALVTAASLIFVIVLAFVNRHASSAPQETTGHVWDEDLTEYDNPLPVWWLYLLYLTVIFGFAYLILYPGALPGGGALNWTQVGQYEAEVRAAQEAYAETFAQYAKMNPEQLAENATAMKTAARLFSQNCAVCHGADARGAPGIPNLRDDDWIYGSDQEAVLTTILKGRSGIMPGWEPVLGGREAVEDVTNYVLQLSGDVVNVDSASRGEAHYKTLCIACHGMDGKGVQQLGGVNLTDRIWLHGDSFEEIADVIANGVNNYMPAHEDILGDVKSRLLAGYVIRLSN